MLTGTGLVLATVGGLGLLVWLSRAAAWAMFALAAMLLGGAAAVGWAVRRIVERSHFDPARADGRAFRYG